MKKIMAAMLSITMFVAVQVAQAASELSIDSKKEVAYTCSFNGTPTRLTAMYGIKGQEPVVAQVRVNNIISPGLFRVPDVLTNRFVSGGEDGTMWTTAPATAAQLDQVNGGILSFNQNGTNVIIVEQCQLDKAGTAALPKAN